jgi:hypothetical protein
MGQSTSVNGILRQMSGKDSENKFGPTAPPTRVIGSMIKRMDEADSFMPMRMCMSANGSTTKLMGMAYILTWTAHNTQEAGRRTSSMGKEKRPGRTEQNTKVIT